MHSDGVKFVCVFFFLVVKHINDFLKKRKEIDMHLYV